MSENLSFSDFFNGLEFVRNLAALSCFLNWCFPFTPPLRLIIAWHLPFNGPCLIPVLFMMPFSHVEATWPECCCCCCWFNGAGCDDTVMEWCVVELFTMYCPSGTLKDAVGDSWWDLKNFGEVRGDFDETKPFVSPFFLWFTDVALMMIFRLGDGDFWCEWPLIETFSEDAMVGSCWRNWRL